MKQKKVLEIWQMITVLVLLVAMLSTMFVPAVGINGKAVGKMYKCVKSIKKEKDNKRDASLLLDLFFDDKIDKDEEKEIDENLADFEKETKVKIRAISPVRIMTHDFASLFAGDSKADRNDFIDEVGDSYKKIKKGYNVIRIALFAVYGLAIIGLILVIVSFAAKLSKLIPLIYTTVYSVIAVAVFGFLRFGLLGSIAKKMVKALDKGTFGLFSWNSDLSNKASDILAKMLSCFYSYALVIALVVAILILIISVVSFVVGGGNVVASSQEYNSLSNDSFDTYGMDSLDANPFGSTSGGMGESSPFGSSSFNAFNEQPAEEIPVTMPEPSVITPQVTPMSPATPVAPVAPVISAMGKVQCTKGVGKGKGFQLPENRKVIVGKSVNKANLIVQDPRVSNLHCSIRYNAANNTYIVTDHSTNGTFVNGVRLQKDIQMTFPSGTILCLADDSNQITLG